MPAPSLDTIVIESQRLRLVPTSDQYADDILTTFTPVVTEYIRSAPVSSMDEAQAYLKKCRDGLAAGTDLVTAVLLKETREFLGHAGIHRLKTREPGLGIWIKQDAHGKGYGREAVVALTSWAFANLDIHYLRYGVDRRNTASVRIVESLGGRVEAEYELTNEAGNLLDLVEYRIYRRELAAQLEGVLSHTEKYETQIQKMPGNSSQFDIS